MNSFAENEADLHQQTEAFAAIFERNNANEQSKEFNELECRQKIFTASRSGNLQLLQKMLALIESPRDQERSKF